MEFEETGPQGEVYIKDAQGSYMYHFMQGKCPLPSRSFSSNCVHLFFVRK